MAWSGEGDRVLHTEKGSFKRSWSVRFGLEGEKFCTWETTLHGCCSASLALARQCFVLSCTFEINKAWDLALADRWYIKSVTCVRMDACLKNRWGLTHSRVSHEKLIRF